MPSQRQVGLFLRRSLLGVVILCCLGSCSKAEANDEILVKIDISICNAGNLQDREQYLCSQYWRGRMAGMNKILELLESEKRLVPGSPLAIFVADLIKEALDESSKQILGRVGENGNTAIWSNYDFSSTDPRSIVNQDLTSRAYYLSGVNSAFDEFCSKRPGKIRWSSDLDCNDRRRLFGSI